MYLVYLVVFGVLVLLFTHVVKKQFNMQTFEQWNPETFPGNKALCYAMPVLITVAAILVTLVLMSVFG